VSFTRIRPLGSWIPALPPWTTTLDEPFSVPPKKKSPSLTVRLAEPKVKKRKGRAPFTSALELSYTLTVPISGELWSSTAVGAPGEGQAPFGSGTPQPAFRTTTSFSLTPATTFAGSGGALPLLMRSARAGPESERVRRAAGIAERTMLASGLASVGAPWGGLPGRCGTSLRPARGP